MHETKHGGQRKGMKTIHISILSQQVQHAYEMLLLAGKDFHFFFFFFFTDFDAAFLYVVIYSGIVDDRQNIFKQPCAGTVTANLYLPGKTRVDLHFFLKCYLNRLFFVL